MTDITIDLVGYRINLRVGAVVSRGSELLLCRLHGQEWWFLPGGRIKTNESSLEAIKRELSEEIGDTFRVIRPLVCAENFFQLDGVPFHEICTFYDVEWTGKQIRQQPKNSNKLFEWTPRRSINKIDLKPNFLKEQISNPKPHFELIIHRDDE